MSEIIKVYSETAPRSRFIGIRYGESDRTGGTFAPMWRSWFEHGRFSALEALVTDGWARQNPEAGNYIGLMRVKDGAPFEYWIGMLLPEGTAAPPGYDSLDLPEMNLGVCWVKGKEPDIYSQDEKVFEAIQEAGFETEKTEDGYTLLLERYQCPRFTQKDEEGQVILDVLTKIAFPEQENTENEEAVAEVSNEGLYYCANCRKENREVKCPDCGDRGAPLQMDDPIYIGELPGRLRNALQIAFAANEIPFNAMANLGSGFTLAAGDLFESYRVYVPFERAQEARAAFKKVFEING